VLVNVTDGAVGEAAAIAAGADCALACVTIAINEPDPAAIHSAAAKADFLVKSIIIVIFPFLRPNIWSFW
jgi:hypothetical protein